VKQRGTDPSQRSIFQFFALVIVLTVPFWLLDAVTGIQLLPGIPVSGLAFICPGLAAIILVYRDGGSGAAATLLKTAFQIRSKVWLAPALLIMPLVVTLSYWALHLSGVPVPPPQITVLSTVGLCVGFFVGAVGEELGWSGYAIDPMQTRWGVVRATLALGAFWAVYHYLSLAQVGRSPVWIAWWSLYTVALRVIIVWLYNNSGRSVLAAVLLHMTGNLTWQLFPINGSYYDIRITGVLTALAAAIVLIAWRRRAVARHRYA
jgi:uncharacterized protein